MSRHRAGRRWPRVAASALAVSVAAAVGVGWSTTPDPTPTAPAVHAPPVVHGVLPPDLDGYVVSIPQIAMSTDLEPVGLNPDGTIGVPAVDTPGQGGLYSGGPLPGTVGPAIVLCHVSGGGQPGCGARFAELEPGDRIEVGTPGQDVSFVVTRVATVAKEQFPTAAVYSDTAGPELRLITCAGGLDGSGENLTDQTIVWARAV